MEFDHVDLLGPALTDISAHLHFTRTQGNRQQPHQRQLNALSSKSSCEPSTNWKPHHPLVRIRPSSTEPPNMAETIRLAEYLFTRLRQLGVGTVHGVSEHDHGSMNILSRMPFTSSPKPKAHTYVPYFTSRYPETTTWSSWTMSNHQDYIGRAAATN